MPFWDCRTRGKAFEEVVRTFLAQSNTIENATISACVNGTKRGRSTTSYDFLMNRTTRVEVKSTQLKWEKDRHRWVALWQGIKQDEYDELYLVLYAPSGLYIYRHDGCYGFSKTGKLQHSCGGAVRVCGKCGDVSVADATDVIHTKLSHMFVASRGFEECREW